MRIRVYYEDTDLAGIVYYANYLRFIERARSEALRAAGIDQRRLREESGLVFAVRRVEADYLSPARFDDLLDVSAALTRLGGASLEMAQEVRRAGALLFTARVKIACLDAAARPARIPAPVRAQLARGLG